MSELSKNEEMILLAVWRLKDNAYGVTIRREVADETGKKIHYSCLYNNLDLLIRKHLVEVQESTPEAVRRGRREKLYYLTHSGFKILKSAQKIYISMWEDIPGLAFENE